MRNAIQRSMFCSCERASVPVLQPDSALAAATDAIQTAKLLEIFNHRIHEVKACMCDADAAVAAAAATVAVAAVAQRQNDDGSRKT